MKKTLTSLTLTSIAAVAIANPTPKVEPATSSSSPIANVNINLPTGGAKPLAKIEQQKTKEDIKTVRNKNQELEVLPLPSVSPSISTVDTKQEVVKEKIEAVTKPSGKEVLVKTTEKTSTVKSEIKTDAKTITQENSKKVTETKTAPVQVAPVINKNIKEEVKPASAKATPPVTAASTTNAEPIADKNNGNKALAKKEVVKTAPVKTAPVKVIAPVVATVIPTETKDVKTEVTLEKKEVINNIQTVEKVTPAPVNEVKEKIRSAESDIRKTRDIPKDTVKPDVKPDVKPEVQADKAKVIKTDKPVKNIKKKQKISKKSSVNKKVTVVSGAVAATSIASSTTIQINKAPSDYILSSKDIKLDVLHNPITKSFLVKFENKDGNNFRDSDFANALQAEGKSSASTPILFTWVNSRLDQVELIKSAVNANGEYLFDLPNSSGKCEAFYVTYKLASDTASLTKSIILDANGVPTAEMDRRCTLPTAQFKEDVNYTKNQYIVSTNWSDSETSINKPVKFTSTITKEGVDVSSKSLRYVILSEDFSKLYYSVGISNKSSILGTTFAQPIQSTGSHFFTAVFNNDKGSSELATTKRYISE